MLQEEDVNFDAFVGLVESNEKKDAQDNQKSQGFDFPVCCGIGDKAIVRFINGIAESALDQGKPGSGRAQLFNIGWVRDDNNKPFLLTLPAIVNNKPMYNHTLFNFIDKVLSRTWIENPNAGQEGQEKGSWKYFYADRDDCGQQPKDGSATYGMTLKQVFWKVFKSGADPNGQFYKTQKSWRGQTIYVANVIDRLDYAWHQQNKKTKLLMRKVTLKDGQLRHRELSFYAVGSGLKELSDTHGTKLNYDVLIWPGAEAKDKYNLKNVTKLKQVGYWDEVAKIITEEDKAKISAENGLTDEEKTWDCIDISKHYHFTTARVILEHFGKTIKAFDMMVGSNFFDEFFAEAVADAKADGKTYEGPNWLIEERKKSGNATVAAQPVATPTPQPAAQPAAQTVAAPTVAQPSFDTMQSTPQAAPEPIPVSAEAQEDINTFYSSLDD